MEDSASPWSRSTDSRQRRSKRAPAQAWKWPRQRSKEKRDLCLTSKCLPKVFVDYKWRSGDFIVEKPSARRSRYTSPEMGQNDAMFPWHDVLGRALHLCGLPPNPGLHLTMSKHHITKTGGHSIRYLASALHKVKMRNNTEKPRICHRLEETKETRPTKCNVGSWLGFQNGKRTLVDRQVKSEQSL